MPKGLAFRHVTYRTSLRRSASSIYPSVSIRVNFLRFRCATSAGTRFFSLFRASRCSRFYPLAKGVPCGFLLVINIAVAASRTGVRCIPCFRAGRSSYYALIAMPCGFLLVINIAVAASRTGVRCIPCFRTSRSSYYALIAMPVRLALGCSAYRTGLRFGASSFFPSVCFCIAYSNIVVRK